MSTTFIVLIYISCLIASYLIGSIPNGILIGKLVKNVDVRHYGSHNSGGTNVARVLGYKYGTITIILDALKIVVPFWLANIFLPMINGFENYVPHLVYLMMIMACIGHCFPIYCKFQGGKAVATFLGCIVATNYILVPIYVGVFLIIMWKTKHVSLGSIVTSLLVTTLSIIALGLNVPTLGLWPHLAYSFMYPIALIINTTLLIFRHTLNIHRLLANKESEIDIFKR